MTLYVRVAKHICGATKRIARRAIQSRPWDLLDSKCITTPGQTNPFSPLRSRGCLCQPLKQLRLDLSAAAISPQIWRILSWQSLPLDQVPD
jgi:hypothetical protein